VLGPSVCPVRVPDLLLNMRGKHLGLRGRYRAGLLALGVVLELEARITLSCVYSKGCILARSGADLVVLFGHSAGFLTGAVQRRGLVERVPHSPSLDGGWPSRPACRQALAAKALGRIASLS
jgi:hypothetical protein